MASSLCSGPVRWLHAMTRAFPEALSHVPQGDHDDFRSELHYNMLNDVVDANLSASIHT
jgi:hypothetical protein